MMRWFNGSDDYIREYVSCWNRSLRKKRVINVLAGLVLIAAGVLCVLFPVDVYQVCSGSSAACSCFTRCFSSWSTSA